jgi:hypothetical protein
MAGSSDFKLKFVIDADGRTAKQELNSIYAEVNKIGGAFTSTFGGAIPILGAVAGGLTAVAGGVALVTAGLFEASKQAAEYGSEIYDASVKTGLTTETISALKLASDRSGTSLENTASLVTKFTKVLGEAAQGSDKARATLIRLGIDPKAAFQDLDTTLGQAIEKINNLPDPVSRATAATQLFGKAGSEFLKVIDDMKGNLPGAVAEVKKLGLAIDKDAAKQADEFGDTLDTLDKQFHAIRVTIGQTFIPVFKDMAVYVSSWLERNQSEISAWSSRTQVAIAGATSYWEEYWHKQQDAAAVYYDWLEEKKKQLGPFLGGDIPTGGTYVGQGQSIDAYNAAIQRGQQVRAKQQKSGAGSTRRTF